MKRDWRGSKHWRRLSVLALFVASQWAGADTALAGPYRYEVQRPGDLFVVCSRTRCRLEPGTGYRFERLFGQARAITNQLHGGAARGLGWSRR
ncbi:MAG: hypothetical protein IT536_21445 [Hyphomicrobiales bacterium]|nr:hypothetical protein [Hyphomicrobiales bacterium]